ncbi:MAG TPA: glycosyltransferase family 39 protein [Saprospiraceae bacterium]|nr:glycosyltransferase family 39 protein [Saprospiraceae bacterium]
MNTQLKANSSLIGLILLISTILCSIVLHWNIFTQDLSGSHIWRQSQTQWNIINFQKYDPNILNPRVASFNYDNDNLYRYEFPLMQWCIGMLHRLFGDAIIITRMSIFLIGCFSLLGFYKLSNLLVKNKIVAALGAWALSFSPVFFYWTVNPIPDNLALCFSIWHLYYVFIYLEKKEIKYAWIAALFLSLATLVKLPFVIFGAAAIAGFLVQLKADRFQLTKKKIIYCTSFLLLIIPAAVWYYWVIPGWGGNGIVKGIFDSQMDRKEIVRILEYHWKEMFPDFLMTPTTLLLFVPGVVLFFVKGHFLRKNSFVLLLPLLMVILYFAYEINMINVQHDYYMFPFLPFLYLAVVVAIYYAWKQGAFHKVITILLLLGISYQTYQTTIKRWEPEVPGASLSLYEHQDALINAVPEDELCIILNDDSQHIFAYKIRKRGYIFWADQMPVPWVEDLVGNKGVKYMYSTSRKIDEDPAYQPFFKQLLLEAGEVKVFELQMPTSKENRTNKE